MRVVVLLIAGLVLLSAVSASATSLPIDAGALQFFRARTVIVRNPATPPASATPAPTGTPARLVPATQTPTK